MTKKEQQRARVLLDVVEERLTAAEAAEGLGMSVRQLRRIMTRYRTDGILGLVHGNRNRAPTNRCDPSVAQEVIRLATTTYTGFNQEHLTEMLEREHGVVLSRMTVRRILEAAGIGAPKPQKRSRHRRRRPRRAQAGTMIQADGSDHDWLEGRGPRLTLVGGIDDATSHVWAVFRLGEDTEGYMELLFDITSECGVPCSWYTDRTAVALGTKRTPERVASGTVNYPTQLSRVFDRLDIILIRARSPQAKGRIERSWRTFQDRLASELRAKGITTLAGAQRVLREHLAYHNRNFEKLALNPEPAWRPVPADQQLADLVCWSYQRVVTNDNTVSVNGLRLQLDLPADDPGWARRRIWVYRRLDGTWFATFLGRSVPATPFCTTPEAAAA